MIKKILLAIVILVSVSCNSQKKGNIKMPDNFYDCWTSSYEENDQKDGLLIFRPCKFKEFAPSRFRQFFKFEKDGKCTYLQAGAADAHFEAVGTWSYVKKNDWITVLNDKKEVVFKFKIKQVEKDLIKIVTF